MLVCAEVRGLGNIRYIGPFGILQAWYSSVALPDQRWTGTATENENAFPEKAVTPCAISWLVMAHRERIWGSPLRGLAFWGSGNLNACDIRGKPVDN